MTVRLAAEEYGAGPPVAILHGLFGWNRNWATIARQLGASHRVIAFDLRNHGNSPWADTMSYAEMAEDVRASLVERGCGRTALIGHSMGGKAAMVAALTDREWVERLVVVDIAPVAYEPAPGAELAAMQALDLDRITRRGEADLRLAAMIPDAAERGFLLQNLIFGEGRPRWRLNLAAIEREMPAIARFPDLPAHTIYRGPALFLAGIRSPYLRAEHEPASRHLFPTAQIARIDNAGHWVHAEQPGAFLSAVERFLADEIP